MNSVPVLSVLQTNVQQSGETLTIFKWPIPVMLDVLKIKINKWKHNYNIYSLNNNQFMHSQFNIYYPFGAGIIFLILAHSVYKMWIIQEPNKLELWKNCILKRKKNGEYTPCLKYSVPIFVE